MKWFAVVCSKKPYDGIPLGDVYSYGTSVPDAATLAAKGLEAIDIGDHPATGPDFRKVGWDKATRKLAPLPPPPADPAADLLNRETWTEAERDAAMRLILQRLAR